MFIKRLPFKLPEYPPRVSWASAHAREVWEPRISAVSQAWIVAERDSVAADVRLSALQPCTPEDLPELMKIEAARGVMVLPLSQVAKINGYQAASVVLQPGAAFDYKVAIMRHGHVATWAKAWGENDDDTIGRLLGTPECCRKAFEQFWVKEKWMDLTVPTSSAVAQGYNGLLRWLGVRGVSYMPCSSGCQETIELASKLSELLPEPVRSWHRELLSFPTRYTSLHGIAEITNPILRMSVASDALAEKVEVRYFGKVYPAEGVQGLGFPYKRELPARLLALKPTQNPTDNGFQTRHAQDTAHNTLLNALQGPYSVVLDLGCGDGTLLAKVPAKTRIGVESDPVKAKKAETRLDKVVVGDCTDPAMLQTLLKTYLPDLVIAQRDRNPITQFHGYKVLSYSYDTSEPPRLLVQPELIGAA